MSKKKSFSLVEVLVALMLIIIIITSMLQIKENNLNFLSKITKTTHSKEYIASIALENTNRLRDENIYLSDKIDFNDDNLRKILKDIKIKIKDKQLKPLIFNISKYAISINVKQTTLSIKNKTKQIFYRFSLINNE
jgi:type II secretory pathway pseudopilin PulG